MEAIWNIIVTAYGAGNDGVIQDVDKQRLTEICARIAGFEGKIDYYLGIPLPANEQRQFLHICFSSLEDPLNRRMVLKMDSVNGFFVEQITKPMGNGGLAVVLNYIQGGIILDNPQELADAQGRCEEIHGTNKIR